MTLRVRWLAFRGVFTAPLAARARCMSWGEGQEGGALDCAGGHAERCGQTIDREHKDVAIVALTSRASGHAQHGTGAVRTPAPTPASQPCGLGAHAVEVAWFVAAGLGLDGEGDAGGGDGDVVDVAAMAGQRVAQPPAFALVRGQRGARRLRSVRRRRRGSAVSPRVAVRTPPPRGALLPDAQPPDALPEPRERIRGAAARLDRVCQPQSPCRVSGGRLVDRLLLELQPADPVTPAIGDDGQRAVAVTADQLPATAPHKHPLALIAARQTQLHQKPGDRRLVGKSGRSNRRCRRAKASKTGRLAARVRGFSARGRLNIFSTIEGGDPHSGPRPCRTTATTHP
jgi:hypothetical protein